MYLSVNLSVYYCGNNYSNSHIGLKFQLSIKELPIIFYRKKIYGEFDFKSIFVYLLRAKHV